MRRKWVGKKREAVRPVFVKGGKNTKSKRKNRGTVRPQPEWKIPRRRSGGKARRRKPK